MISVVFEVGFVAGVQAVVVVHGVHLGLVGIVRGADGVDVVLLHERYVAKHFVGRGGTAVKRRCVVTVHTLEHDALTVDIEQ